MKKFFGFFIFLVILGGAAFFFGWAHLTVPPGSYGVMRSKTHGLDTNIIREGEFRWYWYKLIPTNVRVATFTLALVSRSIRSSGELLSGQVYAALAGLQADFSWEVSADFSFFVRPEALPGLVLSENLQGNEDLRAAEGRIADRIEAFAIRRLASYAENDDGETLRAIMFSGSHPALEDDIQSAFPEIQNLFLSVSVVRFPDHILYQSLRELYREYVSHLNALLNPAIILEAEGRMGTNLRLDELQRYGELLTRYPVLLQFLAMERGFPPPAVALE
ncbi:MAG: hypothetical protein LBG93_08200 [Treponema sp.]|jgi:hypothetical protein|nr:hypothetical protein [Treponema sp.]